VRDLSFFGIAAQVIPVGSAAARRAVAEEEESGAPPESTSLRAVA
jgi:hypothetical protein